MTTWHTAVVEVPTPRGPRYVGVSYVGSLFAADKAETNGIHIEQTMTPRPTVTVTATPTPTGAP